MEDSAKSFMLAHSQLLHALLNYDIVTTALPQFPRIRGDACAEPCEFQVHSCTVRLSYEILPLSPPKKRRHLN